MNTFSERRIKLVYNTILLSIIYVLLCLVLSHLLELKFLRNTILISLIIYPILAYYSKKGKLSLIRPIYLILSNLILTIFCFQAGKYGSVEFMLMITVGIPFFIFSYRREKINLILFSSLPFVAWFFVFFYDFNLLDIYQLDSDRAYEIIYPFSTLSTILLVLLLLTYYFKLNTRYAENVFTERNTALEESNLKSEFLSTMSHEIRTPLNAIVGLSHILASNNPREDQKENINALNYSGKLLMNLLNNVLDFSKLKSSNITLENVATDLNEAIKQIKKVHEGSCLRKGIYMNLEVDDDLPTVLVDIVRFNQIINNLVSNAIKFTEKGGVTLRITKQKENETEVTILTEVIDSGIGIPKDKHESIWEDFSQASSSTNSNYGGTGLGLPIVKSIVNAMGSDIYIKSQKDKGSTFYFEATFTKTSQNQRKLKQNSNEDDLTNVKILLVEDNKYNVMVGQQILENKNAIVEVANNGIEAIECVKKNSYDIVLMDIQMPLMDGYEASIKIKDLNKELPILALTASIFWENEKIRIKNCFNGHIMKPFNPEELFYQIHLNLKKQL